jgi:crotonobetainyl-CoA:carnitine CoA-transferase CaiB-like acyl-CoA transferase
MEWAGAFEGVKVIELAQYVFVPAAGAILADFGAEVIHVEGIEGDPYRTIPLNDGRFVKSLKTNIAVEQNNRGKKSVCLNLKTPEGRELLLQMIEMADVFITSLRPQALERLALTIDDVRARNPQVIYVRGNGLGFRGKESAKAGLDGSAFWARGGFASLYTPKDAKRLVRSRGALGDHAGAMNVAFGIAAALFKRARTNQPSVVETSLLSAAMWMLSADIVAALNNPDYTQEVLQDRAAQYPLLYSYKTRDGRWLQMMVLDADAHWANFCATIGCPDLAHDPRFASHKLRATNGDACVRAIGEVIALKDWEEWRPSFEAFDAPWELAATIKEVACDEQALANEYVYTADLQDNLKIRMVAGPVSLDGKAVGTPARAPRVGEHTDSILRDLGFDARKIAQLRIERIVG